MTHMLRDRQEKEQYVRKFEEIVPMLKGAQNFGWIIPRCDADPVYKLYAAPKCSQDINFQPITVNLKTGWHSSYIYKDDVGVVHKVEEGFSPIAVNDWSDFCYRSNCECKSDT